MGGLFLEVDLQKACLIYRQTKGHVGVKCDNR